MGRGSNRCQVAEPGGGIVDVGVISGITVGGVLEVVTVVVTVTVAGGVEVVVEGGVVDVVTPVKRQDVKSNEAISIKLAIKQNVFFI